MKVLLVICICICVGCGGNSNPADDTAHNVESSSGNEIASADRSLQIISTIGVELGDSNLVFGQIEDACITPDGNLLVLDMAKLNIKVYSPGGDYIETIGRQGSGPGEFQFPMSMASLTNGYLAVSDRMGGALMFFDDSLNWDHDITDFFPRPPFILRATDENALVGLLPAFDREAGDMGYSIIRVEDSSEPTAVYYDVTLPFDPSRIGPLGLETAPIFTADNNGNVFIALHGIDEISITGYTKYGEEFLSITQQVAPSLKTDAELAQEEEDFNEMIERRGAHGRRGPMGGMSISFDPILNRRIVADLGVDEENRLWVRLGSYRFPFFNVYDTTNGELLFTASVESDDADIDDWQIRITPNGMIAWVADPISYPKLNILELEQ